MYNKKILWLGILATVGILASATVSNAETKHDSGGYYVGDSSGSGFGSGFGSELGSSSGGGSGTSGTYGLEDPGAGDSDSGTNTEDTNFSSEFEEGGDSNTSLGKGECATLACLSGKVSINDAAKILEENLDDSVNTLDAAEKEETQISNNTRRNILDETVRRINRNSKSCPNPETPTIEARKIKLEARDVVEKQLVESQKFIEQVNLFDPDKSIW